MKYVVGHQNPDTDSYCSAVVYAQYLSDSGDDAMPIVLGEPNLETAYIFSAANISLPQIRTSLPAGTSIVLVDHNESSQSIVGRDELIIESVIDHHKIANFSTSYPVHMRLEKVGCTCTILAEMFAESGYIPAQEIALLMVSAIISDTLYFRSPTTTDRDRKAFETLLPLTGIEDAERYSMDMFNAKSDLGDMPAIDMVTMDYKTFDFSGHMMGVGVLETTNPAYALGRKDELIEAIEQVKERDGLQQLLVCVVDILEEKNISIIASDVESDIIAQAFGATINENTADLGGRVSRKKQIVPVLDEYFSK